MTGRTLPSPAPFRRCAARRLGLGLALLLAACGTTEGPLRFAVDLPEPGDRVATSVASLEVSEVELPLYAELEEIYVRGEDGALRSESDILWADAPRRAVTQSLVLALSDLTRVRVAADPWPLEEFPEARLEVRFDHLVAREVGIFEAAGQYFVANLAGGSDHAGRFEVAVPFVPTGPNAVAAAKGRALTLLARQVAEEAL